MLQRSSARILTVPLMILVMLTLAMSVVTLQGEGAYAHEKYGENATPYNETDHWWTSNGCSFVPDHGMDFNFEHACDHHDGCYGNHWASRSTCDQWFLNDMRASCEAMWEGGRHFGINQRERCYDRASIYYWGVRRFGDFAWDRRSAWVPMTPSV